MIGSSTYIHKTGDKYLVHVAGSVMEFQLVDGARRKKTTVFKMLLDLCKKWESKPGPDAVVDAEEALKIADATQCGSKDEPGYHKFAGDIVYLVDEDEKKAFTRVDKYGKEKPHWREVGTGTGTL